MYSLQQTIYCTPSKIPQRCLPRLAPRSRSTRRPIPLQKDAIKLSWATTVSLRATNEDADSTEQDTASTASTTSSPSNKNNFNLPGWLPVIGGLIIWAAFSSLGLVFAPDQTPARDVYFVEKALGLNSGDGFVINPVFASVFNLVGAIVLLYFPLLLPSAKSKNKIPLWPFFIAMVFAGNYAFILYAVLWKPDDALILPPKKEDMVGWKNLLWRIMESRWYLVYPVFIVARYLLSLSMTGGQDWIEFFRYFEESRLVHATSLDFASLILLMPFWMNNDASARGWPKERNRLLIVLSCLPIIGPIVYLVMRPRAER